MVPLSEWWKRAFRTGSLFALLTASTWTLGCGGGGASPVGPPPPPPPPPITVSVTPASAFVLLGNALNLSATVSGTSDAGVVWSVNDVPGGNSSAGTITASGIYTAPADMPQPASVEIRATSHADPTKTGSAQITVASDIALSVTPVTASVELGAVKSFLAVFTSSGHPDPAIRWSLAGAACSGACGSIDPSGNYTAPQILPGAGVTVVAQSVADSSKQATAAVQVTSTFSLTIAGPANVVTGNTANFTATLQPIPGSNPNTTLSWSLSGAGCTGAACGTLTSKGQVRTVGGATVAT